MKVIIPKGGSHEDWSDVAKEGTTYFGTPFGRNNLKLWHERFDHLHREMILKMSGENMVINMKLNNKKEKEKLCEGCVFEKNLQLPFPKIDKTSRANKGGEFFHYDVCGPVNILSLGNARYFLLFIDDFNGFKFFFCMNKKGKVFECFKKMKVKSLWS